MNDENTKPIETDDQGVEQAEQQQAPKRPEEPSVVNFITKEILKLNEDGINFNNIAENIDGYKFDINDTLNIIEALKEDRISDEEIDNILNQYINMLQNVVPLKASDIMKAGTPKDCLFKAAMTTVSFNVSILYTYIKNMAATNGESGYVVTAETTESDETETDAE